MMKNKIHTPAGGRLPKMPSSAAGQFSLQNVIFGIRYINFGCHLKKFDRQEFFYTQICFDNCNSL